MFRRAVQRGRTAHAYVFVGPEGVGKRLVAGRADSRIEVSTPIRWMRTFLPGKEPFLDAIFDAFAAGDLAWLDYADQASHRAVERKAA